LSPTAWAFPAAFYWLGLSAPVWQFIEAHKAVGSFPG
jgi:hypothetical protein